MKAPAVLADGVDIRTAFFVLSALGGSSSYMNVDTTLNVYTQVLDGAQRAAVGKVGGELFTIVQSLAPANERSE